MENTGRKRRSSGAKQNDVLPSKMPASLPTCQGAFRVSADQLRELWRHDNECGRKYMVGCPLRTCSMVDEPGKNASSADAHVLTRHEMTLLKSSIINMWKQAATLFEIFMDKNEECEGYRLRVRNNLAAKVSIKQQDALPFGWIAHIPVELSEVHVFKRSPAEPNGYLGGPVSYLNWCHSNKQLVSVLKSISVPALCKIYTNRNLNAGTELRWNYGCNQSMPDCGVWFNDECCRVSSVDPADQKRHGKNVTYRGYCYRELCVLCGYPYSIDNKENRVQRKQHLIGLHADYLGSMWDGCGFYDNQPVDHDSLFCKADELNFLLGDLRKMNWNVFPACKVFSQEELESYGEDEDALMDEFTRRNEMYRVSGTLVLRGTEVPSKVSDFTPIEPRKWKVITWNEGRKPVPGRFAVPSNLKYAHELRLQTVVTNFCDKYL